MKTALKLRRRPPETSSDVIEKLKRDPVLKVSEPGKDPIPMIVVAVGASFGAMLLSNILESAAEGVTRPATSMVDYMSRVQTVRIHADAVTTMLLDATLSPVLIDEAGDGSFANVTDATIKQVLLKAAEATAMASALISEDAGEIAMEAIQEAFSNAVYYGLGGAYALWAAYRVGLTPPNDFIGGPEAALLDPITRGNLDALVGQNVYSTTAQEALRIAAQILDAYGRADKLDALLTLFARAGDPLLTALASLSRQYETIGDYLVELVRAHLAVLQRRVVDAIDEVRAAYADYRAGLIDELQMRTILQDAILEMKEILAAAEDILRAVEEAVNDIVAMGDADLANIASIIDRLETAMDTYYRDIASGMSDYVRALRDSRRRIKSTGLTWRFKFKKLGTALDVAW